MKRIGAVALALALALALATSLATSLASAQEPILPYSQNIPGASHQPVQWFPVPLISIGATVTLVATGPHKLAYIYCYNPTAAVAYLQLFDIATAAGVMLGTTSPVVSLGIPTAQASGFGPALVGLQFKNGIQAASTTTAAGSSGATQNCNVAYN